MSNEIWKPIKDYENLYQVSSFGRVKSLEHYDTVGRLRKERILSIKPKPYCQVCLSKNGEKVCYFVHRLVAETFIPNPDNLPCVNHKDENPSNNYLNNLEWCTQAYNTQYSFNLHRKERTERLSSLRKGKPSPNKGKVASTETKEKLRISHLNPIYNSTEFIDKVEYYLTNHYSQRTIASIMGCSRTVISKIASIC